MSIEFFEGWETVGTETGLANEATTRPRMGLRWDDTTSGGMPSTDSFFLIDDSFGEGFAVNMGQNGAFSNQNGFTWECDESLHEAPGASFTPWIIGFRVHVPIVARTWTVFSTGAIFGGVNPDINISIDIENSSNINIGRANPFAFEIANADGVLTPGAWHYIEIKFKVAEEADGGFVEVYLDGDEIIPNTVADTNNSLTTGFTGFSIGNTTVGAGSEDYVGFDDVYAVHTGSSPHTDFLTPVRVRSLPPNADILNGWDITDLGSGANYEQVDENGASAADYVETDVNNDRDRYGITDSSGEEAILAVKVEVEATNTTGGDPSVHLEVTSGTATESTEFSITNTTAYELNDMYVQDDPAGGAWTNSAIDALRAGYLFTNNVS